MSSANSEEKRKFKEIYEKEIFPMFLAHEVFRKRELRKSCFFIASGLLLIVSAFTILIFPVNFPQLVRSIYPPFGWISGFAMLLMAVFSGNKSFSKKLKADCLPRLLKVFGDIKWRNNKNIIGDEELKACGLFADYNIRNTDDEFIGTYKNVPLKICETQLLLEVDLGKGKITIPVFKGVVISIYFNKPIKNRTIVATKRTLTQKNSNWIYLFLFIIPGITSFTSFIKGDMLLGFIFASIVLVAFLLVWYKDNKNEKLDTVNLEDPVFSKKFNVYSSNQVEARYLVTTAFMERFNELNTAFGAKAAKCSFCGDKILFAISTNKNLFEIGSLFKTLENSKSIESFYNELSSVLKIIDDFKLNEKTGL